MSIRTTLAAVAAIALACSLAACESPADAAAEDQADAIEATGEAQADALEAQAADAATPAQEEALEDQADAVEQAAGRQDRMGSRR